MAKRNDYILITDASHPYFLQIGKVDAVLDGTAIVVFKKSSKYGGEGVDNVSISEDELSIISKPLAFK